MKNNITFGLLLISLFALLLSSCDKKENELENLTLFNAFDTDSGIELLTIDSVQRGYGSTNFIKGYFHLNTTYVDTSLLHRIILFRDGAEKARLSPGNFTFFGDITAIPGATYNYQLSLIMKDSSYTKLTQPYVILF